MATHRSSQPSPNAKRDSRRSYSQPPTIVSPPTAIPTSVQREQARLRAFIMQSHRTSAHDAPTGELDDSSPDILTLLRRLSHKSADESSVRYLPLPRMSITEMMTAGPCWRIELHGLVQGVEPLGVEVRGDVTIGRGPDSDLDLDAYGGYKQAVSRRHAMLRPTHRQLFLIDLGSTNGTTYNMIPLARCQTHSLKHNDVITLGLMTMTVKIVQGPAGMVPAREVVTAAV